MDWDDEDSEESGPDYDPNAEGAGDEGSGSDDDSDDGSSDGDGDGGDGGDDDEDKEGVEGDGDEDDENRPKPTKRKLSSGSDKDEDGSDGAVEPVDASNANPDSTEKSKKKKKKVSSSDDDDDEGDDEEGEGEEKRKKKKSKKDKKEKKKKRKKDKKEKKDKDRKEKSKKGGAGAVKSIFQDEAEESSGSDSSDDSELDKGENQDEFERDGFVVHSDEEDSEGSADEKGSDSSDDDGLFEKEEQGDGQKKRKVEMSRLQRKTDLTLDADDLDLIAENAMDNADPFVENRVNREEIDAGDEIMPERIRRTVYEGDDDADEMDDFIEDDLDPGEEGDSADEERQAERARRRSAASRTGAKFQGPTRDQIQEAMDVFGEDFNIDDLDSDEDDDEEGDVDLMEEPGEDSAKNKRVKKILSRYERDTIVEKFCTEQDEMLRSEDQPERFLNIVGRENSDEFRKEQAEWIEPKLVKYMREELMERRELSPYEIDDIFDERSCKEIALAIAVVLSLFQEDKVEVPFIWTYRRDYLHPRFTRDHLWFIFAHEEKWDSILRLRNRIFDEMQNVVECSRSNERAAQEEEQLQAQTVANIQAELDQTRAQLQEALMSATDGLDDSDGEYDPEKDIDFTGEREADNSPEKQELIRRLRLEVQSKEVLLDGEKDALAATRSRYLNLSNISSEAAQNLLISFPQAKYDGMVESCTEEQELTDIHSFFKLLLHGAEAVTKTSKSRKTRRNAHTATYENACQHPNLVEFVREWTTMPSDVGDAVRFGMGMKKEPPMPEIGARHAASRYVTESGALRDEESVLKAARTLAAIELAYEPSVRASMRATFRANATFSSSPTAKGVEIIGPFHDLFGIHCIRNKPLYEMYLPRNCAMYLKLYNAQREGLVTLTIKPPQTYSMAGPEPDVSCFLGGRQSRLREIFHSSLSVHSDRREPTVRESWDMQREKILEECVKVFVVPSLIKDAHRDLSRLGKDRVLHEACKNFRKLVNVGPHRPKDVPMKDVLLDKWRGRECVSIWVPSSNAEPLCLAHLDINGKILAHDLVPVRAKNQKKLRVKEFLKKTRAKTVIINISGGIESRSLQRDIERSMSATITQEIQKEARDAEDKRESLAAQRDYGYGDDDNDDLDFEYTPEVVLLKDDIARIFRQSRRASMVFPELDQFMAAAVVLGRFSQEPLAEYCNMWTVADSTGNFGYETLFLDLHPQMVGLLSFLSIYYFHIPFFLSI